MKIQKIPASNSINNFPRKQNSNGTDHRTIPSLHGVAEKKNTIFSFPANPPQLAPFYPHTHARPQTLRKQQAPFLLQSNLYLFAGLFIYTYSNYKGSGRVVNPFVISPGVSENVKVHRSAFCGKPKKKKKIISSFNTNMYLRIQKCVCECVFGRPVMRSFRLQYPYPGGNYSWKHFPSTIVMWEYWKYVSIKTNLVRIGFGNFVIYTNFHFFFFI